MEGVLRALHESGAGIYVGAEYLGSLTVADDVLLADQKSKKPSPPLATAPSQVYRPLAKFPNFPFLGASIECREPPATLAIEGQYECRSASQI